LLVLDEPTNHLDAGAVRALIPALTGGPDRPAMLLISHDPAVARGMDEIYHLAGGRLRAELPSKASTTSGLA
jgi:ATPase subunit of ABC transporter with duplicated ATPase domains